MKLEILIIIQGALKAEQRCICETFAVGGKNFFLVVTTTPTTLFDVESTHQASVETLGP